MTIIKKNIIKIIRVSIHFRDRISFKIISKLIKRNKNVKSRSLEAKKLAKLIFKKNNLIIETFANLKDNNSSRSKEYLKSLITILQEISFQKME